MSSEIEYNEKLDDGLLRNLVRLGEPDGVVEDDDLEVGEELFELFIEGKLEGEDREQFLRYLDRNPRARVAASEYMNFLEVEAENEASPATISLANATREEESTSMRWTSMAIALAACLLLAVGYWSTGPGANPLSEEDAFSRAASLASQSSFGEASQAIEEARAAGIESPRLDLLAAQVAMQEPHAFDTPDAWSLRSFDYEYDGTLVMDGNVSEEEAKQIDEAGAAVGKVDPAVQLAALTRGRLLLKQNQAEEARDVFGNLLTADASNRAAWLGMGIAEFMIGGAELEAAETTFRKFLIMEPDSLIGRVNLAMCLAEAGKIAEAVEEWRKVDLTQLDEQDRASAAAAIEELEAALAEGE